MSKEADSQAKSGISGIYDEISKIRQLREQQLRECRPPLEDRSGRKPASLTFMRRESARR